ncbi:hypothetical protein An02g03870 [Aspergillus niger]|uniref:Uncharacterized protein n=2 Tax=Aspergillus niger TaxID=5061 RepID=A2QCK3_ASPNC|nr:hypothetical protein An02g03870 [Aspergillus niger]CAL00601.1 hypothetical protein An02g03870 [Aspergillus niger]
MGNLKLVDDIAVMVSSYVPGFCDEMIFNFLLSGWKEDTQQLD